MDDMTHTPDNNDTTDADDDAYLSSEAGSETLTPAQVAYLHSNPDTSSGRTLAVDVLLGLLLGFSALLAMVPLMRFAAHGPQPLAEVAIYTAPLVATIVAYALTVWTRRNKNIGHR